ncbi:putative nuclease HARBI1 [Schistocerca nitens]|uniref:putative nuclease HARBI1 n=1 Tax=Schistocerca nitens TaxID=7011 RepID=UPI0021187DCD|nr:putative nuclease HARBI1 [Schistocerca nitens]
MVSIVFDVACIRHNDVTSYPSPVNLASSLFEAANRKAPLWIRFPRNINELETAKVKWQSRFKFPCAVGAVDCTHIPIMKPSSHGDEYVNRKGFPSINVQATCDNRDEGYGIAPWLMTPFQNPETPDERAYNRLHSKETVIIERCFGQVKRRFPILQNKIRLAQTKIPSVIIACFVLHNVAKHVGDEDFEAPSDNDNNLTILGEEEAANVRVRGTNRRRNYSLMKIKHSALMLRNKMLFSVVFFFILYHRFYFQQKLFNM